MRVVAIFLALCIAVPDSVIQGQVWFGDTAAIREGRPSRGYFYVDTSEYIGYRKVDPAKPWVEQIKPPLFYYDVWMWTGQCQGIPTSMKDFRKYRWFIINRETFGGVGPSQIQYGGYHLPDSMAIYLSRKYMNEPMVIAHEVTHALMLKRGEKAGHTFRRFGPFGCAFNYVDWKSADPEK